MIAMLGVERIAEMSATRIADCILPGVVIAISAGLVSSLSRRQSSGTRFGVWFSALTAIATWPLIASLGWSRESGLATQFNRTPLTLPSSWALYLFGFWVGIAAWLLVRIALGLCRLHALRKSFITIAPEVLPAQIQETLKSNRGNRSVSLCTSARVKVPAAVGLIKPVVVIPQWALDEFSTDELDQVLLHELAHLRRRDDWTNLFQQVVKAIFFFHPAVWWIERKVSLEREMACDDAVLAETRSPRRYAECLKHIAEKSMARRTLVLAQSALGRVRQTSMRVIRILDPGVSRKGKHGWRTGFSLAGFLILAGFFAAKDPQLFVFRDKETAAGIVAVAPYRAPVIPAVFKATGASAPRLLVQRDPVRPVLAKNKVANLSVRSRNLQVLNSSTQDLVHLTSLHRAQTVPMEAVLVVVENQSFSATGQSIFEIQVWHLTVLHPAVQASSSQIPRKEI
jgi:beta-lactamase regulating signal transducer with metallopeptidase domain